MFFKGLTKLDFESTIKLVTYKNRYFLDSPRSSMHNKIQKTVKPESFPIPWHKFSLVGVWLFDYRIIAVM